ncbi:quinolinate synthase NadA [Clostridium botulinum]|nr:quinolinate synthase NadA [Clostridium botulinum]
MEWFLYNPPQSKVGRNKKVKSLHTDIKVLCHGECEKEIRHASDFVGSTGDIIKFATESNNKKFLIVTEEGILHQLKIKIQKNNSISLEKE